MNCLCSRSSNRASKSTMPRKLWPSKKKNRAIHVLPTYMAKSTAIGTKKPRQPRHRNPLDPSEAVFSTLMTLDPTTNPPISPVPPFPAYRTFIPPNHPLNTPRSRALIRNLACALSTENEYHRPFIPPRQSSRGAIGVCAPREIRHWSLR